MVRLSAISASKREPSKEPTQKDRPEGGQFLHGRNRPVLRLCARGSALAVSIVKSGALVSGLDHFSTFSLLERIRFNSRAFVFTDPTWRPSNFAILSALTFLLANILNCCTSASVHC